MTYELTLCFLFFSTCEKLRLLRISPSILREARRRSFFLLGVFVCYFVCFCVFYNEEFSLTPRTPLLCNWNTFDFQVLLITVVGFLKTFFFPDAIAFWSKSNCHALMSAVESIHEKPLARNRPGDNRIKIEFKCNFWCDTGDVTRMYCKGICTELDECYLLLYRQKTNFSTSRAAGIGWISNPKVALGPIKHDCDSWCPCLLLRHAWYRGRRSIRLLEVPLCSLRPARPLRSFSIITSSVLWPTCCANVLRRVFFSCMCWWVWESSAIQTTRLASCQYTWPQYVDRGENYLNQNRSRKVSHDLPHPTCTFVCDTSDWTLPDSTGARTSHACSMEQPQLHTGDTVYNKQRVNDFYFGLPVRFLQLFWWNRCSMHSCNFKSLDPRPPRRAVSLGCLCMVKTQNCGVSNKFGRVTDAKSGK